MTRVSLVEQASKLLSGTLGWLSPSSRDCLVCAKPRDGRKTQHSILRMFDLGLLEQTLCYDCLSHIPWLQRIYCAVCGRGISCEDCLRSPTRSFQYNRSAVQYDERMKSWLARYKYRGDEQLSEVLGTMLIPAFERLTDTVCPNKSAAKAASFWDGVVYVPISKERAEERGFNQAEQLACFVAERYGLPLFRLLERSMHTEKQSFKSRAERIKGTQAIFTINQEEMDRMQEVHSNRNDALRILLVDDIYTTGSTVTACANKIHQHAQVKIDVFVLTWARS